MTMLKAETGEQADILYHILTEQMTKAEIKAVSLDSCRAYKTLREIREDE